MALVRTFQGGPGDPSGETEIDDGAFDGGRRLRPAVLREAVVMYEANRRQGTVNTLTRRFVSGSTKKFQKQKHTGNARHGDRKAPLFRGGGVAHGPHPRDHSYGMPRKALRRALQVALAAKLRDGQVRRWAGASLDAPSTRLAFRALSALDAAGSALIVSAGPVDRSLLLSVRNLPRVRALPAAEVSAYDVVFYRNLVLLDGALEALRERLGLVAARERDDAAVREPAGVDGVGEESR